MSTEWKAFQLVPHDVLFFRDGKPSTRGADHYLRSLFPPNPSTLYGAVRTRRLLDHGVDLKGLSAATWSERLQGLAEELGPWGGFGSLQVRGPWLVRNGEPLVPAPADLGLWLAKDSAAKRAEQEPYGNDLPRIQKIIRFRPSDEAATGSWSHPLALLFPFELQGGKWAPWRAPEPGDEPRSATGEWFLTPRGLGAWQQGSVPEAADFVHRGQLWTDEPRTGVGLRADRRMHEEGLLYTFGFVRLRTDVALGFEARSTALEAEGLLRFGGEGRTAALRSGPPLPAASGESSHRFTLSFLAPALSETGGVPPGFALGSEHGQIRGRLQGRDCRLVAAVLPRFALIGGWDLAGGVPKPLRRAIPAGSVFHFETADGAAVSLPDVHGQCFSSFPGDHLAQQGFGLAVAGTSP